MIDYEYVEMRQKDIKPLREKLWIQNGKKCPVLNKEIRFEDTALDHIHGRINDPYSPESGVIRTTLDFRTNAVLGKLENAVKRTGLHLDPDFSLPEFLRNAADYFEAGAYEEDGKLFVHPNEVKKDPSVSKRNYNKLAKEYKASKRKARFPEYPKSKKLTKALGVLFEEFGISPYN